MVTNRVSEGSTDLTYDSGSAVVVTNSVPAVCVGCVAGPQLQSDHWTVSGTFSHCLVGASAIADQLHEDNSAMDSEETRLSPNSDSLCFKKEKRNKKKKKKERERERERDGESESARESERE